MHRRAIRKYKRDRPGDSRGKRGRRFFVDVLFPGLMMGLGAEVLFCIGAVVIMSVCFVFTYKAVFWLAICSLPIAFLPGIAIGLFDKNLAGLCGRMQDRVGRLQTGFLSFFACLLGCVIVFLLLLGYPMSLVFRWFGLEELAPHYGRWTAHLGIVVAIIVWLRCSFRKTFTWS